MEAISSSVHHGAGTGGGGHLLTRLCRRLGCKLDGMLDWLLTNKTIWGVTPQVGLTDCLSWLSWLP